MDKKEIAHILHEIGVLLELKGENQFKTRAFFNAARTLEMVQDDVGEMVANGRLQHLKGIGKTLAGHIAELVKTGDSKLYHDLRGSIPDGLMDMLRIPGLGPKKIHMLYHTLDISEIAELEYACHENRLLDLKGFGRKTQEGILKGIDHIRKFQGRFLFSDIMPQAVALLQALQNHSATDRACIAGSLRRSREIVKDIDLVAASEQGAKLMELFRTLPQVAEVTASGSTRTSVVLESGAGADLRVVGPQEFACALHHFTGSREHNTALRQRAKSMGMKMNEYGLFRADKPVGIVDEAGLFRAVGLDYIPPELRENMGELEAAAAGCLPDLLLPEDIRGVFHVHTSYSDGAHSLEEMAEEAKQAGFAYLGISDHSRTAVYAGGLTVDTVRRQHEEIRAFNAAGHGIIVFHGIESDIHPDGSLDYPDDVMRLFDFVIASVHSGFSITGERATQRLVRAMENPYVTMLGHPTGRLLLGRDGYNPDMNKVLAAARANNVIVELNANPMRLDIDWRYLKRARELGVRVSINPDAHRREGLYDTFQGVGIARKGWLEKRDVFNALPVQDVKRFLEARKPG